MDYGLIVSIAQVLLVPGAAIIGFVIGTKRREGAQEAHLAYIVGRLDEHHKTLYGNGRRGVQDNMILVLDRLKSISDGIDQIHEHGCRRGREKGDH